MSILLATWFVTFVCIEVDLVFWTWLTDTNKVNKLSICTSWLLACVAVNQILVIFAVVTNSKDIEILSI
jgi:hypothetical protein